MVKNLLDKEGRLNVKSRLFAICGYWHKAGRASPLDVARVACFEALACVFASAGALLEKPNATLTKN